AVPDAQDHPVSAGQQRLWVLDRLAPGSAVYNMTGAFRITGPLDTDRLRQALAVLMQRHESLRTEITVQDGKPRQHILPAGPPPFSVEDLTDQTEAHALAIAADEGLRPFDLSAGPLWRARLLRLAPEDNILICNLHHAISDGWSLGVLVQELSTLYQAPEANLPPLAIQYRDYAAWQDALRRSPAAETDLAWWKNRLAGADGRLDLPTDRPRGFGTSGRGAQASRHLDAAVTTGIARLAAAAGTTPLAVQIALVAAVLHRYTGSTDLVIGTVAAGRDHPAFEDQIGFFANTLPLRHRLDGSLRLDALIAITAAELQAALTHAATPFEQIVEALGIPREPGRTPLLDVVVVAGDTPLPPLRLGAATAAPVTLPVRTRHFDLALFFRPDADGTALSIDYDSDLFDAWRIDALAAHIATFAANAAERPDRTLSGTDLLTPAERERLEVTWNATATAYPRDTGIVALFREQARLRPDTLAVIAEGAGTLTYAELDRRSDALAARLATHGAVQPGDLIGIAAPRTLALITGLLGILKAGAAYVPIDPAYPSGRVAAMFAVAPINCLLTDGSMQPPQGCPVLPLEAPAADAPPAPIDPIAANGQPAPPCPTTANDL
ncbi:MAG TPA: condensation domain-containing protein, partial [Rhodopila sp.]|nr:condensation domain-containing protein [Rhodopila sp.]